MKAILIRIGIDKAYGALSPVFNDDTFVYVPIYNRDIKEKEKKEKRTYGDYEEMINKAFYFYLPESIWGNIIHLDPEFKTFTYGDPAINKRNALLSLKKEDLLVFYMGGKEVDSREEEEGCFFIGYFKVDIVINWDKLKESEYNQHENIFKNNAHIRSSKSRKNLVLIKGLKSKSKLLKYCIKITKVNPDSNNPPYITTREIQEYIGIRENITRAIPIVIKEKKHIDNLKELLEIKTNSNINFYQDKKISYSHFCRIVRRDKILSKNEKLLLTNFFAYIPPNISDSENESNFRADISYDEYKHKERMLRYFNIFYRNIVEYD